MKIFSILSLAVVFATPLAADAAKVEIKGAHLCCGACVKAVATTLGKVKGVSDAACDREAKTITFNAEDAKIANMGIRRLLNAGFYGTASIDGKAARMPKSGAKKGQKADSIAIRNVHLCCGGCVTAASKALKSVEGVEGVEADRKKNTVTVTGKQFDVNAAIAALNKEGFNGRVGARKKRKKKD